MFVFLNVGDGHLRTRLVANAGSPGYCFTAVNGWGFLRRVRRLSRSSAMAGFLPASERGCVVGF